MNLSGTHWYVLYTLPRWEKKVAQHLAQKGIEHYCPLNRVSRQWSDRRKVVEEPLFSAYVFVRVNEAQKWEAKETRGVLNYVYWQKKPAIIPDKEIETIKRFLNEHQQVVIRPIEPQINDAVRILAGPFMNREASVLRKKGKWAEVQIPALGLALRATIAISSLEITTSINE